MKVGMNKIWILVIIAMIAVLPFATAAVVSPLSLTRQDSSTRDLSGLPTQNAAAVGGNVTEVDIDALTVTKSWQGFYGSISAEMTLDNAAGDTFYNWSYINMSGEVYATRNAAADFTTIDCASGAERLSEQTYLNQSTIDVDSVTNTFNTTTHDTFDSGAVSAITGCYATVAHTDTGPEAASFQQVLLADGVGVIVYTTIIDNDQTGFDSGTYDFELLVGEDEKSGGVIGSVPYFFFVELD